MARVLLVEDNPMNQELETIILEMAGHTVIPATSGAEALQALESGIPDIILLDLALPGMSGLEIAQRVRGLPGCEKVVMVVVSANCSSEEVQAARDAGCAGLLPKPINVRTFVSEVEAFLR